MKKNTLSILCLVLCISAFALWNCNGPRPSSPSNLASVSVAIPVSGGHNDAFSVTNDIIEYVVTGPQMSTINGSTTISSSTLSGGTANFSVNIPSGSQRVLAIEAKDLASGQPLALGAVQFNLSSNASTSNQMVELGSLTRNCYVVNNLATNGVSEIVVTGTYSFLNDNLTSTAFTYGPGWDIQLEQDPTYGGFYFIDAGNANGPGFYYDIAYMGNGDLVNFAYIPSASLFQQYSSTSKQILLPQPTATPYPPGYNLPSVMGNGKSGVIANAALGSNAVNEDLALGDVYCIQLQSIPGAYAWVQITNAGVPGVTGPSFIYRACSTAPFFAFQRTGQDSGPNYSCIFN